MSFAILTRDWAYSHSCSTIFVLMISLIWQSNLFEIQENMYYAIYFKIILKLTYWCAWGVFLLKVLSRGTWLQSQNDVYLSICLFGKIQKTTRTSSVFPLTFYEKLRFEKVLKFNTNTGICKIHELHFSKILLTALCLWKLSWHLLFIGWWTLTLENYFLFVGCW